MTKENFSLDDLNPVSWLKKTAKLLLLFLLQTFLFGSIFYLVLHKIGLLDDQKLKNYLMYLIFGSVISYAFTFAYFAYLCRNNKFDPSKLSKISLLGPSVVFIHIIILFVSTFLFDIPEFGPLVYLFVWSTLGTILIPGILYTSGVEIAQRTASCSSLF